MEKPKIPMYLCKFSEVNDLLSSRLKQWAFTLSMDGNRVRVHHKDNVRYVKNILAKAGIEASVRLV